MLKAVNETVEFLTMSDGFKLFARHWVPLTKAGKTVVCIHGLGGCCGCFKRIGASLASKGMNVWGFDLRGFGNSKEVNIPRGDIKSFSRHIQDIDEAVQEIRDISNGHKLFLLGHSLGGLYALWYGAHYSTAIEGLVLAAPSVENKPIMTPEEQAKFSLAAISAPETMLNIRENTLNACEQLENYLPVTRSFSIRYFIGLGNTLMRDKIFENAANNRKPILILQGDADEDALPIGAERLFESIVVEDKKLEVIPGAKHTLYGAILSLRSGENDLKKQGSVLSLISDWLRSH
jgi:alpha-beta hydrolase superfamily lysophospholipase